MRERERRLTTFLPHLVLRYGTAILSSVPSGNEGDRAWQILNTICSSCSLTFWAFSWRVFGSWQSLHRITRRSGRALCSRKASWRRCPYWSTWECCHGHWKTARHPRPERRNRTKRMKGCLRSTSLRQWTTADWPCARQGASERGCGRCLATDRPLFGRLAANGCFGPAFLGFACGKTCFSFSSRLILFDFWPGEKTSSSPQSSLLLLLLFLCDDPNIVAGVRLLLFGGGERRIQHLRGHKCWQTANTHLEKEFSSLGEKLGGFDAFLLSEFQLSHALRVAITTGKLEHLVETVLRNNAILAQGAQWIKDHRH